MGCSLGALRLQERDEHDVKARRADVEALGFDVGPLWEARPLLARDIHLHGRPVDVVGCSVVPVVRVLRLATADVALDGGEYFLGARLPGWDDLLGEGPHWSAPSTDATSRPRAVVTPSGV